MAKFKGKKSKHCISIEDTLWKPKKKCIACNGSGRHDHNGSPKCNCCDGTGYELEVKEKGNELE